MKLFLLIPCLLASYANAVDIRQCPPEMIVTYNELTPMSDDELEGGSQSAIYHRNLLKSAVRYDFQGLRFQLFDVSRERCRYLLQGQRSHSYNETRLFTRDGETLLRVSIRIGPEFFWIVHKVDDYSPFGVSVSDLEPAFIFGEFLSGMPRTRVGRAFVPLIE